MAVITSKVSICNLALSHLDSGIVADIDTKPQTETELECARWYDTTRRGLLRRFVWNFARKRAVITRDVTAPIFGFTDAYTFPNDYLRLLAFGNTTDFDEMFHWDVHRFLYEIEGRKLLINNDGDESVNLIYIYDNISVNEYDALFVETLALKLAYKMAYKFTTKKSVVDRINTELEQKTQEAVSIDGQERPPKKVQRSRLGAARRRHGTSTVAGKFTIFRG